MRKNSVPSGCVQWRHKSKISEKLGWCGRQNILRPYLKIWDWDWIFGRAMKAISSLGVRSPCLQQIWFTTLTYHTVPDVAGRQIMQMLCVNIDVSIRICYCEKFKYCLLPKFRPIGPAACILMWPWKLLLPSHNGAFLEMKKTPEIFLEIVREWWNQNIFFMN